MNSKARLPRWLGVVILLGLFGCAGLFWVMGNLNAPAQPRAGEAGILATSNAVAIRVSELESYVGQRVTLRGVLAQPAPSGRSPVSFATLSCDDTDDWHKGKRLCHYFLLADTSPVVKLEFEATSPDTATRVAGSVKNYTSRGGLEWTMRNGQFDTVWVWDRAWHKLVPGDSIAVTGTVVRRFDENGTRFYSVLVDTVE